MPIVFQCLGLVYPVVQDNILKMRLLLSTVMLKCVVCVNNVHSHWHTPWSRQDVWRRCWDRFSFCVLGTRIYVSL